MQKYIFIIKPNKFESLVLNVLTYPTHITRIILESLR